MGGLLEEEAGAKRGDEEARFQTAGLATRGGVLFTALFLSSEMHLPRNHFLGMTFSWSGFPVAMSSPKNSTYSTLGGIELSFDLTNILWRIPS
jgi:hypothetical protein